MKPVLDSRQLLAARVLADTGSFTLAGQHLCLTQSAVSHAIKALEEEVGCRLFHRSGRGVSVTPAGRHFLEHADRILAQMDDARTLVTPRTSGGKERVRLGVGSRAREMLLPAVQPLFQREFPGRLVPIPPGTHSRSIQLLASGLLDLALMVQLEPQPELEFAPLFEDELRFIVAASHPWARAGHAACGELEQETLMVFQEYHNTALLLTRHLRAERIVPRHGVELADHRAIMALVRTGRAVGVCAPWLAARELQDGSLVSLPLGARPLRRQWGLAYVRRRTLAPMEQRLIELCRQAVPGIMDRLLGLPTVPHEKKESAGASVAPEARVTAGGVR